MIPNVAAPSCRVFRFRHLMMKTQILPPQNGHFSGRRGGARGAVAASLHRRFLITVLDSPFSQSSVTYRWITLKYPSTRSMLRCFSSFPPPKTRFVIILSFFFSSRQERHLYESRPVPQARYIRYSSGPMLCSSSYRYEYVDGYEAGAGAGCS